MDRVMDIVAARLREAREREGYTQAEIGVALNLSGVGYGAFERNETEISLDYLFAVARIFHRPVTWFLGLPSELTPDEQVWLQLYREGNALDRERLLSTVKGYYRR